MLTPNSLTLGLDGFTYADLHQPARLRDLYEVFCARVAEQDPQFWSEWDAYRQAPDGPHTVIERSDLIVRMAPHVGRFVTTLFGIEHAAVAIADRTRELDVLFRFKIDFVRKRSLPLAKGGKHVHRDPADEAVVDALAAPWAHLDREMAIAHAGCALMDREIEINAGGAPDADKAALIAQVDAVKRWCASCLHDWQYRSWVVFKFPETLDPANLVPVQRPRADLPELMIGPDHRLRRRDGFGLTDDRGTMRGFLDQIHYCVLCHERDKDSCSKGLRDKQGAITPNALGVPLHGCPLDEKISEMHMVRKHGDAVGALAIVAIDNPMCPGTGHRICNDCMKACIYQKQEPVNIPWNETSVLTDVLDLPWGVEIYGLLTRWNPLNVRRPYPLPYNGRNILVVGLGPAGYTLAHHLLNDGFGVVAVDGLKIEPLPEAWTGKNGAEPPQAIEQWTQIYRPLDERVLEGFGGVSEYGITVRWDKNFLTLMHLTLARRSRLRMYSGIRFGGTLTLEEAWEHGFDHVAFAAGAGSPTIIDLKNNLVRGVRQASDFLMALQLGGAFKRNSLTSLQARLPAIVVGGGLTGVDTTNEMFAYYPIQVEKTLEQYETLCTERGEAAVRDGFDAEELAILDEFLEHGRAVRGERRRAAAAGEAPDFVPLVRGWGGVTLAYRKRMQDAPAYRLNHEEVGAALDEGMGFAENLEPRELLTDDSGHLRAVVFKAGDRQVELPARTLLVAAGTTPNVIYEKELPGTFALDPKGRFFLGHRAERTGGRVTLTPDPNGFFTSYNRDGRLVSYYGDNHPSYAGNVVRAMASAKHGSRAVATLFEPEIANLDPAAEPEREARWTGLVARLDDELVATVAKVERLTPNAVDVIVRAPAAARHFQPGQFYRLQNFEASSPLAMEGIALAGTSVDRDAGLLSLVALEKGASSRLVAYLRPGDPVVVMGPTGTPTELPDGQSVALVGGGYGNAILLPIAQALRAHGNRVIHFAGYGEGGEAFKRQEIEAAADQVIWTTVDGIVDAMVAYAEGRGDRQTIALRECSRLIVAGPDTMMAAVQAARHGVLAPYLRKDHAGVASLNSPMQCMMKEVCAQCLQKHVDPATGRETFVYSCAHQGQPMDVVDFPHLAARLRQNTVQEKLANGWLDHLLASSDAPHA